MVLKLYCFDNSTASLLAAFILHECKVPYEAVLLDIPTKEHKSPDYLAIHPFGQVPAIVEDNGFKVFESRAICRYIVAKYAPNSGLIPNPFTDPEGYAKFEEAVSVETSHFSAPAQGAYAEGIGKMKYGFPQNIPLSNQYLDTFESKLDVYEQILSKQKYAAGDKLTLADLFHLHYGSRMALFRNSLESGKWPNVTRWWKEISVRPAWLEVKDGIAAAPKVVAPSL